MGNRLGLVKRLLQMLVEQLRGEDSVSIVEYGSEVRILLYLGCEPAFRQTIRITSWQW